MRFARTTSFCLVSLLALACAKKDEDKEEKKPGAAKPTDTTKDSGSAAAPVGPAAPAVPPAPAGETPAATAPVAQPANVVLVPGSANCKAQPKLSLTEPELGERDRHDLSRIRDALAREIPGHLEVRVVDAHRDLSDSLHVDFVPTVQGVPLCGASQRAHVVRGEVIVPRWTASVAPRSTESEAFGTQESALSAAAAHASLDLATAEVFSAERCLALEGGALEPAWQIFARIDGLPYRIVAGPGGVREVEPQVLHAAGTATVFRRNVLEPAPAAFPLDLADDGTRLASARFKVVDKDGALAGPTAAGGAFAPAPGTPAFIEVSMFAHAEEMLSWFAQYTGFGAADCLPIELEAHATVKFDKQKESRNNAVYLASWSQKSGNPRISLGDGDGELLQNIGTDFDAVAHELGHHFVYRVVKALDFEPSLVIHEGLADFFVFAYTGDTCLGESLCPAESGFCILPGQCLRVGDSDISGVKFNNEIYAKYSYHVKSQALSGYLIALGRDPAVGVDAATKIAFSSIEFLKAKSTLNDFVVALLLADKASFKGTHACAIVAKAKEHGLNEETVGVDCNAYVVP